MVFLGNPGVWWFGTLAVFGGSVALWRGRRRFLEQLAADAVWRSRARDGGFLLLLYFSNWLPFAFIRRDMYAYHYLTAMLAAVLFGCWWLSEALPRLGGDDAEAWFRGVLGAAAAGFLMLAPFVYGFLLCAYWSVTLPLLAAGAAAGIQWLRRRRRSEGVPA